MCQDEAPPRFAMLSLHCGIVVAETIKYMDWAGAPSSGVMYGGQLPAVMHKNSAPWINSVEECAAPHHVSNLNYCQQVALFIGFVERGLQDRPWVEIKN